MPSEFVVPTNVWAGMKSFSNRGGFFNGLIPNIVGKIWFAHGQNGSDGNPGSSPSAPFATITRAMTFLNHGDYLVLSGVFKEQIVAPLKYDITIIGGANRPRQATSGGVPTGGGASWLAPTVVTAGVALIEPIAQGWKFYNIQFAPPAGLDCIRFRRMETVAIPDASHGTVSGCYFSTGGVAGNGINVGECKRILIEDCDFEALGTGTAIRNIADGGIANPNHLLIRGNRFHRGNAGDIIIGCDNSIISDNIFRGVFATEGGWRINLAGGAVGNQVINNYVADVDTTIALGFKKAVAADIWRNFVATVVDPKVVVPA
jgi:hypothetical protein